MWDYLIVGLTLIIAVYYLINKIKKSAKSAYEGKGCAGGCCGCTAANNINNCCSK